MYCAECKLRVADDSITVCPVCQGPLQPDTENEEVFGGAVDKDGSAARGNQVFDIRVEDKFVAYNESKKP